MLKPVNYALRLLMPVSCLALFAGILFQPTSAQAQTLPGWSLVWQDEFTQADGTPPNPANWGYDLGGGGWGNGELQVYTSSTSNARIETNHLIIEARETSPGNYTSARILTKDKWAWTYGRMEARIKIPYGQGIWPAFWMLGANFGSVGWPNCGEIDIMENIGSEPRTVHGTIHGPGYSGGGGIGGSYTYSGEDVSDDFRIFAIEWSTNIIRWYADGINYHTVTPASLGGNSWVFDHPFFFILNVAVGGQWPGYPDGSTVFPQQMIVDYVRVYTPSNAPPVDPPAGINVLVNPGFETGALGPWVGYSAAPVNELGTYIESTNNTYYNGGGGGGDNVLTHSGDYVGKIFGDFTGAENFNGCYQDIAVSPGSVWNAEGWALTHAQDLMSGTLETWIEVSFRNAADTVLALYRSDVMTSGNVAVSTWMHRPVKNQLDPSTFVVTNTTSTLTAPAGTTKARYQLVFQQPAPFYDNGAMYYDDLYLGAPLVVAPVTLTASLVGNNIQISFPTQNGVNYDVVYKNSLADSTWQFIETVAGDGTTKSVSYPATNPARAYAVQIP